MAEAAFQQAKHPSRQTRITLWRMVLLALLLRLLVMAFLYPERLNPDRDHWRFAGETGRIARSIAEGQGFSSPLFANTGPTAWLTPVFPYLLAGVFKGFGVYTKASAIAILSLDCLFSALTCLPVFFIARKHFGERAAGWAGWAWAFFPYAIYFSAYFIWPTTLATLLLSTLFLVALNLERSPRFWSWSGFGLLGGFAALTDPIVVSVLPFLAAWMCYRLHQQGQRWIIPAAGAALAFFAVVTPWFVRNYRAFHAFIPFRSGFGLELYFGNNGNSWHWGPPGFHPSDNEEEWREYQQLGEVAYMAKKQRQALAFIEAHPGWYVGVSLRRVAYMWTGFWSFSRRYLAEEPFDPPNIVLSTTLTILAFLGLHRAFRDGIPIGMPYVIVFLFFPVIYYLTHPEDYHRRPIDPMFVVLSVYALTSCSRSSGAMSEEKSAR